jgi:ATP-binding protein involved in chromosome partitioning
MPLPRRRLTADALPSTIDVNYIYMNNQMRIAVPVAGGVLAMHFGHAERFALLDVDRSSRQVAAISEIDAPPHQPGLLPPWLQEQGVQVVIAGGMGSRAVSLFHQAGIEVLTGAPAAAPAELAERYLNGTLATGENVCDH